MKAVIVEAFGPPENLKIADLEMPSISENQVLIQVKTTCVNYADVKARYGAKGAQNGLPLVLGLEAAGIVAQTGSKVTSVKPGQRVLAFPHHGSYAEYIVAEESLTFPLPDYVDFETAGAGGIVSFLSYKLITDIARMKQGEDILIHSAAGGVGTTAIQVAKALGAHKVYGTVGNERKIAAALNAGADHVICYENCDFAREINNLTAERGVDVILDSLGGGITEASLKCLDYFGRLVIFGNSNGQPGTIEPGSLHASCRSILGFSFGTTRKRRPETLKDTARHVFRLFESGALHINISERLPLSEAAAAHRLIESRKSTGKIVLYT